MLRSVFPLFIAALISTTAQGAEVDFNFDVKPILSDRCFHCHGPDAQNREADMRLDLAETLAEHETGSGLPLLSPGDPENSEIFRRIASEDEFEQMPPPEAKIELSEEEIDVIWRWIEQGGEYQPHWSFSPIERPAIPSPVGGTTSPIDAFVQEKLAAVELALAPPAESAVLLRRLSFDLTGLPPTVSGVDAFLADDEPDAYLRRVDRLLASPAYGERMATPWLDLSRYADTHGYQADRYIDVWPWRDWVIDAFNGDMPYDEFITAQLAGDLAPDATREQILATAFNRLHRQNEEGGSTEEEFRVEYVADRTNTFGAAFLGLTMECARCHDHKFDPISQEDYYSLFSFFDDIDESGLTSHFTDSTPVPTLTLTTTEEDAKLAALAAEVQNWSQKIQALTASEHLEKAFAAWKAELGKEIKIDPPVAAFSLDAVEDGKLANRIDAETRGSARGVEEVEGVDGKALSLSGDDPLTFGDAGAFTRDDPFSLSLWIKAPRTYDRAVLVHRTRAWHDAASRGYELLLEDGRLSFALIHMWPGDALRVVAVDELPVDRWVHVTATYDGSCQAKGARLYVDGKSQAVEIVRDKLTRNVTYERVGVQLTIGERFRDRGFKEGAVDEFRVYDRALTGLEVEAIAASHDLEPSISLQGVDDEQLLEYFIAVVDGPSKDLAGRLREARKAYHAALDPTPELMVMRAMDAPRQTYLLERGAYDALGQPVESRFPTVFGTIEIDGDRDRLALAKWLAHPDHPLTARVQANRLWQAAFGFGLVATPEDFGSQGALPTHPELLDWLAAELRERGWSNKFILRRLVTSATYQQSSIPSAAALTADPDNRLLSRSPVRRRSAEMIRDAALAVSGLLVRDVGGKPVKPYQPAGVWKEVSGQTYQPDAGAGLYRRSLYTIWKRTAPPPGMVTFDAANREACVIQREITNSASQALLLLNDVQYVEAARYMMQDAASQEVGEAFFRRMFRRVLSREPTTAEMDALIRLYDEQLAYYRETPTAADALLGYGESEFKSDMPKPAAAALTVTALVLLNFDEAVMRR